MLDRKTAQRALGRAVVVEVVERRLVAGGIGRRAVLKPRQRLWVARAAEPGALEAGGGAAPLQVHASEVPPLGVVLELAVGVEPLDGAAKVAPSVGVLRRAVEAAALREARLALWQMSARKVVTTTTLSPGCLEASPDGGRARQ